MHGLLPHKSFSNSISSSLIHLLLISRIPASFLSLSESKLLASNYLKLMPTAFVSGKENAEMHVVVVA